MSRTTNTLIWILSGLTIIFTQRYCSLWVTAPPRQLNGKFTAGTHPPVLLNIQSSMSLPLSLSMNGPPCGKRFYLYGFPIARSTTPAFHNHFFKTWHTAIPNTYETWSTSRVTEDLVTTILQDDFGGAA